MRRLAQPHTALLRYAGLFTWACVGIPLVLRSWYFGDSLASAVVVSWWIAYLGFGLAYLILTRGFDQQRALRNLFLLGVMTAGALAISHFTQGGLGGILLLVVAGVLPWLLSLQLGAFWLVAQNLALIPVFAQLEEFSLAEAVLQGGLYLGYSSFTFITSLIAKRQAEAREALRRVNGELRATQTLLSESSRVGERLRISRELHDLVGHHLTALSLNLEVASHLATGKALDHVRQAQSLARLLLADVREVVSHLREDEAIDLSEALKRLVEGVPTPAIHLELPEQFHIRDPARAQVLLRCAQEIITNTVRHAQARNLWLSFRHQDGQVSIQARDDGRGASSAVAGNGLKGMAERLRQFGGEFAYSTQRGQGFSLDARLPLEAFP